MKCAQARLSIAPFLRRKRFFKRNLANCLVQKWANKSDEREKQAILANTGSSTMEFVKNREKFWKTRHIGSPCDHHSRCSASTASFYLGTFSFMLYSTSNKKILRQIKNFTSNQYWPLYKRGTVAEDDCSRCWASAVAVTGDPCQLAPKFMDQYNFRVKEKRNKKWKNALAH